MKAKSTIVLLRPLQWTKNAVVGVPFFFALWDGAQAANLMGMLAQKIAMAGLAVVAFSLTSSAIYIINDVCDRKQDRLHPEKRHRPIASGEVSVPLALGIFAVLAACVPWAGLILGGRFLAILGIYVAMQLLYSFGLKRVFLLDVFIIAVGFVLRVVAGGVAVAVQISWWLILCTFLLALFLALCKRRAEKTVDAGETGKVDVVGHRAVLSRYSTAVLDQYIAMSGMAAIVCYAIYTLAAETVAKFGTSALAVTVPFVMFGIFRYMYLVYQEKGGGRPEKILVADIPIIMTVLGYALAALAVFVWG